MARRRGRSRSDDSICFYQILQIHPNASLQEIKKQYRLLAKRFHPDKNPDDESAEETFKLIGEAYSVLSDEKKRALYDKYGRAGLTLGADTDEYANHPFDMSSARDLFAHFFQDEFNIGFMPDPFFNRRSPFDSFGGPAGASSFFDQPFGFSSGIGSMGFNSMRRNQPFHQGFRGFQDFFDDGFDSINGATTNFSSVSTSYSSGSGSRSVKTTTTINNGAKVTTRETTTTHPDGRVERHVESNTQTLTDGPPRRKFPRHYPLLDHEKPNL